MIFEECLVVGPLLEHHPTQIENLIIHGVHHLLLYFANKPFFFELLIPLLFMVVTILLPLT